MRIQLIPLAALALSCSACMGGMAPPPEPPPKTAYDAQLKALDKAKGVQQTVDQQKKDMDKRLEQAENAGADASKKNE